jgi:cysteine-rich repeat protein
LRRGAERMLAAVGLLFCVATSDTDESAPPPPPEQPEPPPSCQDNDLDGWCVAEDCDDFDAAVHGCPCVDYDLDGICQSFDCDDSNANVWDDCEAGTCDDAFIIEGGTVDTTAFSLDEIEGSCGATGGERVYAFDVNGEVNVLRIVRATVSSLRPHAIEVRDDCALAETALACAEPAADHSVEVLALPGTRLYIIVEAATYEDQTDFELSVSSLPLVCGDGIPAGPEECDDGNMFPGDGCDAECRLEP